MSESSPSAAPQTADAALRTGIAAGLATYLFWGLLPLYLKLFADMPPPEVLAHRIVWSVLTLVLLVGLLHGRRAVMAAIRCRRTLITLTVTALLITANWLIYIFAVAEGRLLQASMGYYINPLINVLFGRLFLKETMTPRQVVAVVCAAAGVSVMVVGAGEIPLIALSLALSFGTYGLLRKTIPVDGASGLFVESLIIGPAALGYLLWLNHQGVGHFGHDGATRDILLVCAGPITAVPLVLFGYAVRRVRLSTMGLMQYVAPTGQFLLATLLYGEPFTQAHLWAFSCIWTGLAIYSIPRDALAMVGLRIR
ncbi:EamA family transporter RarD [Oleispirillum naphthae]|uniref:EamA family transporter RarD n=1 Tax=Oleispirillum naphthae TaxID=2838853 RepID=UPI003082638D